MDIPDKEARDRMRQEAAKTVSVSDVNISHLLEFIESLTDAVDYLEAENARITKGLAPRRNLIP